MAAPGCGGRRLERISPHRENGRGERDEREREHVERGARVRDKAAKLLAVVRVPRVRVPLPRPWNTFTGFTANRHVYTMLIIRPTQPLDTAHSRAMPVSRITTLRADSFPPKYVDT